MKVMKRPNHECMMDCAENYTRFAMEVREYLINSGNGSATATGDKEFVQTEDGDDGGKQNEDDSIKLTQDEQTTASYTRSRNFQIFTLTSESISFFNS